MFGAMAGWACVVLGVAAGGDSLYLNGGFEAVEAVNEAFLEAAARSGVTVSPRFPQVWQVNYGALAARGKPHLLRPVEDPRRAHSGRWALELNPGEVFLPAVPVTGGAPVTLRFWATGRAAARFSVRLAEGEWQTLDPPVQTVGDGRPDAQGYREYLQTFLLPDRAVSLSLTLGADQALLDDVSLEVEGLKVAAPDLTRPVGAEEDTLALATGDAALPEGSVFTGELVGGRFGRAYRLGREDVLQVPGRFRDLLQGGTIELWLRPRWPGQDQESHALAILSSDGFGYQLLRTQYDHLLLDASEGWHQSLGNVQSQHWQFAHRWAGGDWHHVAVSWTSAWYTLFVDGFPVDTALTTTPPATNTSWCSGRLPSRVTSLVGIGSPGTDIDEFRISRRPRYGIGAAAAPPEPPRPESPGQAVPLRASVEPSEPLDLEAAPAPRELPAEFFVDGENPAASDDNPGTRDRPFQTLNRGVRELRPGDTLTVRGGTYREGLELKLLATAEHPITLQAAPGETVVIKGSEVVKGWVKEGNLWRREGWTQEFVTQHCTKGCRLVSPDVMEVFQRDGRGGDAVVLFRVRTPEELRPGKCYWDEATGVLTIWPYETEGPFDPNVGGVEVPVRGWGLSLQGRFVRVRGFQFRQFGMAAITNWPSVSLAGKDCVLEDCQVTWADFVGISVSGFRQVVRRCEASYCGNSGLGGGVGEGILIEDGIFTHNNFWRYSPGWHGGGAKLIPWFNRSVVRNSEFAYNYGPGLWLDGSCNDSVLEGNRCHDNEGPGIMVEISRGCLVRNNCCYNNRNSLPGTDLMPVEGQGYAPTRCQANRVEGGGGGHGIFISSSPQTKVYHNLCYRNEQMGLLVEWGRRTSLDVIDYAQGQSEEVAMSTHDVDLRNNLLVNNAVAQLSLRRNGVDEDTYNNRSDSNLFFSSSGAPLVVWGFGNVRFTQLDRWRAASGCDLHSLVGAPRFEFSPGLDFRLQPGSPGVDQGEWRPEVPTDARGLRRPLGSAVDIGPFETLGPR